MESVLSNIDILCEIFKYLKLNDLLTLTKVCETFSTVITEFLWKNIYQELEVFKTYECRYIIANKIKTNYQLNVKINCRHTQTQRKLQRHILNHSDFLVFLQLNAKNVEALSLCTSAFSTFEDDEYEDFITKFKFSNLKVLHYERINLTEDNFQCLSLHCPKLENVYLINCLIENPDWYLQINDIQASKLVEMKMLKSLSIVDDSLSFPKDYEPIEEFLTKLKTPTCVEINITTIGKSKQQNTEHSGLKTETIPLTSYEELTVGQFQSEKILNRFINTFLIRLTHLRKLTIIGVNRIALKKEFFITLNKTCHYLEYLNLNGNINIEQFVPIPTLNELILHSCRGFTCRDFKVMLSDMKLKRFTSISARYKGEFELFNIATSLEHLYLGGNTFYSDTNLIDVGGEQLKKLSSLHCTNNFPKQIWIHAAKCPNLKKLEVNASNLLLNNITDFRFLETLILNVDEYQKFVNLLQILQHPTLINLLINEYYKNSSISADERFTSNPKDWENFKTNLLFINIHCKYELSGIMLSCWFNLLNANLRLKLKLQYCASPSVDLGIKYLSNITNNPRFPSRLKSVNICGYNIDLEDLKNDYTTIMKNARQVSQNSYDNHRKQYILLGSDVA